MYDSQPQRVDQAIFRLMKKVLSETEGTNVLVSCGRSWSLSSRRIVKSMRREFGKRIVLALHPDVLHRLLLFARADLTVWAPRFESFGLIGLSSLCMGAPVISWDIRPQNEFLKGWKNSVLVPAKTKENWLGVPEVTGGYNEFGDMLVSTLRDKALIAKMKTHVLTGLDTRRRQFEAGWDQLIR
jgi:glycosyltransferase involved in cell wall biosynthesis